MTPPMPKITFYPLPDTQYLKESSDKVQLYIHHTASSPDPYSVFKWWASTDERVATAFVVGSTANNATDKWKDGEIVQCYSSKFWGYHLGLKAAHLQAGGASAKNNLYLNKMSIGIEICSWGQLSLGNKGYMNYVNRVVPDSEVCEYKTPYRGFKYYQKYTPAQLESTFTLARYLCNVYGISTHYKGDRMFNVCADALQGASGIWTHTSVRPDKNDMHPQPELIAMLKGL